MITLDVPCLSRSVDPRAGSHPAWGTIGAQTPFVLADGSGPAAQRTRVRICRDEQCLHVRFECEDLEIWSRYTERDDPLYEEEVVEVFLAPGPEDPESYFEFEVSPAGVLFDAQVHNPGLDRSNLTTDKGWNCAGISWSARVDREAARWDAELAIPWRSMFRSEAIPRLWRANFYRIDRPTGAPAEFSCWSTTSTDPADFHRPRCFGLLRL